MLLLTSQVARLVEPTVIYGRVVRQFHRHASVSPSRTRVEMADANVYTLADSHTSWWM